MINILQMKIPDSMEKIGGFPFVMVENVTKEISFPLLNLDMNGRSDTFA